jgi:hypothetical protein
MADMKSLFRPFGELLALVGALVIWSFAFVGLYGVHGTACASGWASPADPWALRMVLIVLWLGMSVLSGLYVLAMWRRRRSDTEPGHFLRYATVAVAAVGAVATAWLGAPLFLVRVCA